MEISFPKYFKYTIILLGLVLLIWFLQTFKSILVPICFSGLFALLLVPLCERLERWRFPRPLAILLCIILIIAFLAGLIWLLSSQLVSFIQELTTLSDKVNEYIQKVQVFLLNNFGIKPTNGREFITKNMGTLQQTGTTILTGTLSLTTGALSVLTIIPIYIFFMLYYREHFRRFMFKFITRDKRSTLMQTIDNIQKVVASYITGLLIVIVIVAILNMMGLMIMGVPYAVFFGIFASVLTIIPYIGILIGAALPALYTLVLTGSLVQALVVIGIFAFVQFLEGNFITPNITGSKVSINPFAAILALIIGGEIWGAAGMILSIPIIAILKVLFDAYEPLEPFGFLLSDINNDSDKPNVFATLSDKVRTILNLKKEKEQQDKATK
ncbi:AI-2E family transporter [Adhaeribacter swui]|uniref:AI-2E family transporter n=1 Tax=Adhaeribacter swui TaxID=2086471 RepID=A0A7G7GD04_9BACT|nr:AI-2E family transporter [Adhaeribacter swui]QNF35038.1 AI-2E family transporter [Adhaeribacter swui]